MKVLKEDIPNLERCIENDKVNLVGSMPIVMADAFYSSEKAQEEIDKEMEEHNKATEVKLNKVIGAEDQPVPDLPIKPKAVLDESLFEDINKDNMFMNVKDYLYDVLVDSLDNIAIQLHSDFNEYDADWCSEEPNKYSMKGLNRLEEAADYFANFLLTNYNKNESLVEDYNNARKYSDMLSDMIDNEIIDVNIVAEYFIDQSSEDDIKRFMILADLIDDEEDISETLFKDESLTEARKREDIDLFDQIYIELSVDSGHEDNKRKISRKEFKNSKRFRFDDEVGFNANDGPGAEKVPDSRNARVDYNKFILDCVDEEQLEFAKKVAEIYDVEFENNGLKAIITIPEEML